MSRTCREYRCRQPEPAIVADVELFARTLAINAMGTCDQFADSDIALEVDAHAPMHPMTGVDDSPCP